MASCLQVRVVSWFGLEELVVLSMYEEEKIPRSRRSIRQACFLNIFQRLKRILCACTCSGSRRSCQREGRVQERAHKKQSLCRAFFPHFLISPDEDSFVFLRHCWCFVLVDEHRSRCR